MKDDQEFKLFKITDVFLDDNPYSLLVINRLSAHISNQLLKKDDHTAQPASGQPAGPKTQLDRQTVNGTEPTQYLSEEEYKNEIDSNLK